MLLALTMAAIAQDVPPADPTAQPGSAEVVPPDPPSAARLCADAAAGNEVEVCLRVVAANPEQVNGVVAALRAHIDRRSATDRELLVGLLLLLSGDQGSEGARLLGELGDPRAVSPLAHASATRETEVALAAVASLGRYQEGLEPLSTLLDDRSIDLTVRIASAGALGALGAEEGADALLAALRRSRAPPLLRQAIVDAVRMGFPHRATELDRQVTRDGSLALGSAMAMGLGYSLGAAGYFGKADLSAVGALTGGLAGGTAGWLVGRAWPIEADEAMFVATTGGAATLAGVYIGGGLTAKDEDRTEASLLGGLGGEILGYSLGAAFRSRWPGSREDAIESATRGAATAIAGASLVDFVSHSSGPSPDSMRPVRLAAGIGLVGGLGAGYLISPAAKAERGDGWVLALGATYGGLVGSLVPVGERPRRGLPLTGLTLGAIAGYSLMGRIDLPRDVLLGAFGGMVYGTAFGLGGGLLLDGAGQLDAPLPSGLGLMGASVGTVVGGFTAMKNRNPLEASDVLMTALGTTWLGWQAVGWWTVADGTGDSIGLTILIPAAGGATVALLSPLYDVPIDYQVASTSVGLWGGYLGAVGGHLDGRDPLPWALAGSDIGLVVGIIIESPLIDLPPVVIAIADAGGVLGGSIAALSASFATREADPILAASLVGAGVGLAGGATLGAVLYRSGATRDIAWRTPEAPRWSGGPTFVAGDHGLVPGLGVEGEW